MDSNTSASLQASEALSAKGATHPRVSLADLNEAVAQENYFNLGQAAQALGHPSIPPHHPLSLMTICALTLKNGFTVIGKSAPASPENFDADKGKTFAREDAIRQLWPLMGFSLRDRLSGGDAWENQGAGEELRLAISQGVEPETAIARAKAHFS